jgi:hypothetical protein
MEQAVASNAPQNLIAHLSRAGSSVAVEVPEVCSRQYYARGTSDEDAERNKQRGRRDRSPEQEYLMVKGELERRIGASLYRPWGTCRRGVQISWVR